MTVQVPYSSAKSPPIPILTLDLHSPDGTQSLLGLTGILDTAADRTLVPLPIIEQLKLRPIAQVRARGFGTAAFTIDVYRIRLAVTGVVDVVVDVLGHSTEPQILVGRDILNQLRVTFDGPNQLVEIN